MNHKLNSLAAPTRMCERGSRLSTLPIAHSMM